MTKEYIEKREGEVSKDIQYMRCAKYISSGLKLLKGRILEMEF